MTSDAMRMVLEFHRRYGLPAQAMPREDVPYELGSFRWQLGHEESSELIEAIAENDLVKIADALADVVYVAYGTAATYGIDLDDVLAEVHRSNMTKEPPETSGGKARKGEGYEPPDVERALYEQMALDVDGEERRLPSSLGAGKDGPGDLSGREGFGDG
jgi:predicted HAD superfamily Cof-like phosphohydrolase